jgi:basic membrane protein A
MPLLPERSEFGAKWTSLYKYQVEEGIQEPVVAYEFMNQFYVQEGNKRVSVMKYLGAYSIPGSVTRLIPKRTDDKENRLYYEFLDFYRISSNCDVWFSKEGSYKKLLELMGIRSGLRRNVYFSAPPTGVLQRPTAWPMGISFSSQREMHF